MVNICSAAPNLLDNKLNNEINNNNLSNYNKMVKENEKSIDTNNIDTKDNIDMIDEEDDIKDGKIDA